MLERIRKAQEEHEGGFTLIELLVVIIIIGILAAIAIPVFLNQRKKAVDASLKSDLRTMATAEETYFVDNRAYLAVAASTGTATVGTQTVKLSPNNSVTVVFTGAKAGTYCVKATNPNGTDPTNGFVYQSDNGGLQGTGGNCTGY
ncbi:MAG TPA: prepilin-type N-terminal cleavage/methylation domain-containing protein [Actinomycetes bacterium]